MFLYTDILPPEMLRSQKGVTVPSEAPSWSGWASLADFLSRSRSDQIASSADTYQPGTDHTQQALVVSGAALDRVLYQISAIEHTADGPGGQDVKYTSTRTSEVAVKVDKEDRDDSDLFGLSYFNAV
jgi:hypothetical protein